MDIRNVCLLGGTGFVGSALAAELAAHGRIVRLLTRDRERAKPLTVLPTVRLVAADVHDEATLVREFRGMDAVINLVGILHETRGQTFERCHAELPAKVARACEASGVRHLVHMSAMAVDEEGPSEYLRSKGRGERAVRETCRTTRWTIFRPSVIFGAGDSFLNLFAMLVKLSPVVPLAGANARFQPVWVDDVAACFDRALGDSRCFGGSWDLGGPRVYTLGELVRYVGEVTGHPRAVIPVPMSFGRLQAALLERLPGKLMTRDNLRSMSVDNVSRTDFPTFLGVTPTALEAVAPSWLARGARSSPYARFRDGAGR